MKGPPIAVPQISVRNLQRTIAVDRAALEQFARRALPLCAGQQAAPLEHHRRDVVKIDGAVELDWLNQSSFDLRPGFGLTNLEEISVLLISDRRMAELHRRFMQISGSTDVMTFQHGEIFISVETARRQAKTYRSSLAQELRLYLVHALLHLYGFDDRDPDARRRMHAAQKRVLARA